MSRLAARFAHRKAERRTALIPFITAGDPDPAVTVPLMHALVSSGADVIELGVPFSDPMADGPVIQKSSERALRHGTSLTDVLGMVRAFRENDRDTPVVLMGYLNPVEVKGYAAFAKAAQDAGVDGVLTVDLPPEEAEDFVKIMKAHGLDPVFLLAPTTTDERIRQIASVASGFLYYVSLRGVTGAGHLDLDEVERRLMGIRAHTALPIGVGFGISGAETAARAARFADAVIVGSAIVRRMAELEGNREALLREVPAFIHTLRSAMDQAMGQAMDRNRGSAS